MGKEGDERLKIWASPDFLLTIKIGTIDEHAVLLASLFRSCKYENIIDLEQSDEYKRALTAYQ